jgi:hypothetical protein
MGQHKGDIMSTETLPQRVDYMAGRVTHEEFYRSINKVAGLSFAGHPWLPRVGAALAAGDEHLNTIPLYKWDALGANPVLRANLARAVEMTGDWLTAAVIVCCLKQAAKDAALGVTP